MTGLSAFDEYLVQGEKLSFQEKEKLKFISAEFQQSSFINAETREVRCKLEYCVLNVKTGIIHSPIFFVPGLSSSYRAAESLVKILAIRTGSPVVVISKPNSGLSEDLPSSLRKFSDFHIYSELIFDLIKKVLISWVGEGKTLQNNKIILTGTSLSGPIISQLAHSHPYIIESLILIHPVSEKNEYSLTVGSRYLPQLLDQFIFNSQNDPLTNIVNTIITNDSKANNSTRHRLAWRFWEMHTITNGLLPENLKDNPFPTFIISGQEDKLVPPSSIENLKVIDSKKITTQILPGMSHYSPYCEIFDYADVIFSFLNLRRKMQYNSLSLLKKILRCISNFFKQYS